MTYIEQIYRNMALWQPESPTQKLLLAAKQTYRFEAQKAFFPELLVSQNSAISDIYNTATPTR
jgi:hypothetical protein